MLSNMTLKEDIIKEEKNAHEAVKNLLQRYEKFRVSIFYYTLPCPLFLLHIFSPSIIRYMGQKGYLPVGDTI